MTATPITQEAAPLNGHIVINTNALRLRDLFLTGNGNGVWTWCAVFHIGGKIQSLEGGDFPEKSRALSEAISYGVAPSDYWFRRNYPEHESQLGAVA